MPLEYKTQACFNQKFFEKKMIAMTNTAPQSTGQSKTRPLPDKLEQQSPKEAVLGAQSATKSPLQLSEVTLHYNTPIQYQENSRDPCSSSLKGTPTALYNAVQQPRYTRSPIYRTSSTTSITRLTQDMQVLSQLLQLMPFEPWKKLKRILTKCNTL